MLPQLLPSWENAHHEQNGKVFVTTWIPYFATGNPIASKQCPRYKLGLLFVFSRVTTGYWIRRTVVVVLYSGLTLVYYGTGILQYIRVGLNTDAFEEFASTMAIIQVIWPTTATVYRT